MDLSNKIYTMKEIKRDLQSILSSKIGKGKILILIGPRQVGKTTLLKTLLSESFAENSVQYWNCDETEVRASLFQNSVAHFKTLVGKSKFIVIDEAQRIIMWICLKRRT